MICECLFCLYWFIYISCADLVLRDTISEQLCQICKVRLRLCVFVCVDVLRALVCKFVFCGLVRLTDYD